MDQQIQTRSHRKSTRLRNYNYSQNGAYFVTVCTHNRVCSLGAIRDSSVIASDLGALVLQCWRDIPKHWPSVSLDEFVLMPNHFHGIVILTQAGAMNRAPTVGSIVREFKARVTIKVNRSNLTYASPIWQRNYHDRIIRDDEELNRVRQYIIDNTGNWETDENHPQGRGRIAVSILT